MIMMINLMVFEGVVGNCNVYLSCRVDSPCLYCVYTMFPAAPAAPFARNVACRGVLVIYFSDFQDLLRFVTFSYVVLRYP